jgi:RHS repeat-associated protein
MRVASRSLLVCVLGCLATLSWLPAAGAAEDTSGLGGSSSLSGTLVVPGAEALVGSQVTEVEEAKRANPEAVAAREASSSAYESLNAEGAERLVNETFPSLIQEHAGGPLQMSAGERIASYPTDNAATLDLGNGMHGVLSSQLPIATETSDGNHVPVDLSLIAASGAFQPKVPLAGAQVHIPQRLSDGPSLSASGVSMIPVDEQGTPLGGAEGVVDGASVFYADTEAPKAGVLDVDTVVKPTTLGVSTETILRSERSPQKLFFKIGMPAGASLVQDGSGPVEVVDAGQVIAVILASSAKDAEGTQVPVEMSVSGDMVVLTVRHEPGEYRMPIEVDPTAVESQMMGRYLMAPGWWFSTNSTGGQFSNYQSTTGTNGMEDHHITGEYGTAEYGLFGIETSGESRIYEFVSESYNKYSSPLTSVVYIGGKAGVESSVQTAGSNTLCVAEGCAAVMGGSSNWENGAFYKQAANAQGWWGTFEALLKSASLYIVQEKGPVVHNTGSCGSIWTKSSACSVELNATDPGIGINEWTLSSPASSEWGGGKHKVVYCTGIECVQCIGKECAKLQEMPSVKLTGLPDGEEAIHATVQDATGLNASSERVVKIDNAAPHNIVLSGLPSSTEIGAGEYHLKVEASDGTGTSPKTSGVVSIALYIDGKQVGGPSGSCSPGPCTAHGEWTIFGREYATGHHTVTAVVLDGAANSASETFAMVVHPASPVAVGPGGVNPQSGEFSVSATDVSQAGGLTVSRSYRSQHLMTGAEGPLSAQWGFSLGGQETLVKQADGSMVLTDGSGAQTIFAPNGSGGFNPPAGDANLTLSTTPCKTGATEYMLKNSAAGTKTCFAVPTEGSGEVWTPSISEGPVATDTVTYSYKTIKSAEYSLPEKSGAEQITTGPEGNLWFTEHESNKIAKMTTSGTRTEYSLPAGSWPVGITTGPDGNLWFTDQGSNKIGKITTAGVVTEYAQPAESYPGPIAKGSDNNLWFTEWKRNKIVKITTAGTVTEYAVPAGSTPVGITAGPDGNLWFTNEGTRKIGKITTSGTVTEYSLPAGTYPNEITAGPDGNLWFSSEEKIGKVTTAGAVTEYALPESSGASGITAGVDKNVWFTDFRSKKVAKITATGTITEYAVAGIEPHAITSGPDGNIWYVEGTKIGMMLTLGAITEPTEALAPVPAGVSCSPELKRGCRALTFNYASSTTATGEASSEWGDYSGHLTRVYYTAYDPVSKTMKTVEVAHYLYDKQARLRAEWDPRISPSLKTTYGYDTEGHVTALTAAGQETWGLTYGTSTTDSSPGRLLKALQAPASASLWGGEAVKNTSVPILSGSTVVGVRMAVTKGAWTGSPIAYGYTWEDCNTSGGECTPIPGATNPNYTPVTKDVGHKVVVVVAATNGDGSVTAASAASATITATGGSSPGEAHPPEPGSTVEYNVALSGSGLPNLTKAEVEKWAQKDFPTEATAVFPPDESQSWPAGDYKRAKIYYRDSTSRTVNVASPGGAISTSEYNEHNDVARSLSADDREASLKEGAKSVEIAQKLDTQSTYNTEGTELLSTLGPRHLVKLQNGKELQARSHTVYSYDEGAPSEGGPYRLVTKTAQGAQTESEGEQDVRTTITSYSGQNGLGWTLRNPTSVITDPAGLKLTHRTVYDPVTGNPVEASSPAAETSIVSYSSQFGSKGTGNGQLKEPKDVALDPKGNLWVLDTANHRVQEFSAAGAYLSQFGSYGSGNGQFNEPKGMVIDSKSNIWVSDQANNCLQEFNEKGEFIRKVGTVGSGNGQFSSPQGLAADSKNDVWVADRANNRVEELNETGEYLAQFGTNGSGNGQFKEPMDIGIDSHSNIFVLDIKNSRVQEFNTKLEYVNQFGSAGSGPAEFKEPKGLTVDQAGNVWVADSLDARLEEFSGSGEYLGQAGSEGTGNGQFQEPRGIAINSKGTVWVVDVIGDRVQQFAPGSPHTTQTIYYTTAANTTYPACGEHAEWANLPCQTQPAEQPNTLGAPNLPVNTVTYNMYGQPTKTTSTVGTDTRVATISYDEAGRALTTELTSTVGKTLPAVSMKYDEATGLPIEQSTVVEGKTQSVISAFNRLGQLTSYTDADGNIAKYEYEAEKDGRLVHIDDGKGTKEYTYDETTGLVKKAVDTQGTNILTFTATYDPEGNLTSETYPNGMSANYTLNQTGETTAVNYIKTTHCTENCTWLSDSALPSIHGQWMSQQSTLATQNYSYDQAGRLTQVQETPATEGCTTRIYGYDEETNRTNLTKRTPGVGGACATEGGTTEAHSYDSANRLTDIGVAYDSFGDTTKLPATDAGGSELQSSFYSDGQLEGQTQNGQTLAYQLDPTGRTRQTIDTGTVNSTTINHYTGPGDSPTWTVEPASGHWSRNVSGINGFAAIETDTKEPILQLSDLQGNIIATASISETATKLLGGSERPTEYGVPTTTKPAKYSWLGSDLRATELSSGVTAMGARSYIPQLGRFLQTDPVSGGSANAYTYVFGDPINSSDPSGEYTNGPSSWALELASQITGEEVAAYEAALRAEAERKAAEAAAAAAAYAALKAATALPTEGGVDEAGESVEIVGGSDARAASSGVIVCTSRVDNPHNSKHKRGTVNVVASIRCTDSLVGISIHVALFYNHRQISTNYAEGFGKELRANTATPCRSGVYQGWAEFEAQGLESNRDSMAKWGNSVSIRC